MTNVKVYNKETGAYEPLQLDKTYTMAGTNYTLLNCGDGFNMFGDAEKVLDGTSEDYLAMAAYVAAFADTDGDGFADIASANSPLAAYKGYLLNYEAPTGAGRIKALTAGTEPEPVDPTPAEPAGSTTYVVIAGDSLWKIAQKQYGAGKLWSQIYEANKDAIKNPNFIRVGQVLNIPAK